MLRRHFNRAGAAIVGLAIGGPVLSRMAIGKTSELWQPETPSPEAFMSRAIALAEMGAAGGDGTRYGAVIVRDNVVVGEGWNHTRRKTDPTAHAEVEAIQAAARRLGTRHLGGCVLYTNGGRPCPMCETASYWAGLERIYHAVTASRITDAGAPEYPSC